MSLVHGDANEAGCEQVSECYNASATICIPKFQKPVMRARSFQKVPFGLLSKSFYVGCRCAIASTQL